MNNFWMEWNKWMRQAAWMLFLFTICLTTAKSFQTYQQAKGAAISNYLSHYHNIEIPPEQARFFDVNVNQWEISIEDLDIFGSWNNN